MMIIILIDYYLMYRVCGMNSVLCTHYFSRTVIYSYKNNHLDLIPAPPR